MARRYWREEKRKMLGKMRKERRGVEREGEGEGAGNKHGKHHPPVRLPVVSVCLPTPRLLWSFFVCLLASLDRRLLLLLTYLLCALLNALLQITIDDRYTIASFLNSQSHMQYNICCAHKLNMAIHLYVKC